MSDMQLQGISLIILMVPLPLISIGASAGIALLWWLGLALLAAGGVIPAALRYVSVGKDAEDADEEDSEEKTEDDLEKERDDDD